MLLQNIFSTERSLLPYKEKNYTRNTHQLPAAFAPHSKNCVIFFNAIILSMTSKQLSFNLA